MKIYRNAMLLSGAAVLLTATIGSAFAQEPNQNETADHQLLEEVVVTGIKRSLENAAIAKREADTFVDVISAVDLGRFPDENVAESLQRLTGVQIGRERGEGETVNIRGLPGEFSRTQFNGRTIPSVTTFGDNISTSRNFDFSILPSEFVQTIEVYKQPTADLDEGGLAGTIIVRTPRPFEIGKMAAFASAQGSWESSTQSTTPKVSGLWSNLYSDGRLGLTLGGVYSKREPETHQAKQQGFFLLDEGVGFRTGAEGPQDFDLDGTIEPGRTITLPNVVQFNVSPEVRERTGGFGVIQFQATDSIELYGEAFYSEYSIAKERNEFVPLPSFGQGPLVTAGSSLTDFGDFGGAATNDRLSDEILTTLDTLRVDIRTGNRRLVQDGDTLSVAGGIIISNDTWDIQQEVSYSKSEEVGSLMVLANRWFAGATLTQAPGDEIFGYTLHPGDEGIPLDADNIQLLNVNGPFDVHTTDEIIDYRIDMTQQVDLGPVSSLQYGGKYIDRSFDKSNGRIFIDTATVAAMLGITEESPAHGPGSFSLRDWLIPISPQSSFFSAYGGSAPIISQWLGSDTPRVQNMFTVEELKAAGVFSNDATGIIDVKETIYAGYIRANFDAADGKLTGNAGVRIVNTKQESVGVSPDLTGIKIDLDAGARTIVPPADPVSTSHSYTELLPSLNLKLELTDDIVLRVAVSRTMSRPALTQISPTTTVDAQNAIITQQNPNLDPFIANNFDVGLEWYPSAADVISLTYFHKDLISLVKTKTEVVNLPVTAVLLGVPTPSNQDFTFQLLENGSGVAVEGFEFNVQKRFDFLPAPFDNLGAVVNYTFIENSDVTELTASSKHNYNLSAYYESERFAARISYTWRDKFLADLAAFGSPANALARSSLDANITIDVTDRLSAVVEAVNILDEADILQFTNGLPAQFTDSGSRVLFGFKYTLQ